MAKAKSDNSGQDNAPILTDMQRRFVVEYAACLNATRAAKKAGYSDATAAEQGCRLLRNVHIRKAVDNLLEQQVMSPMEILERFRQMARGEHEAYWRCDFGEKIYIDMESLIKDGKAHLIKSFTRDPESGKITKVEFYDAQAALRDLGRYHKMFTDKTDLSSTDGTMTPQSIQFIPYARTDTDDS